MYIDMHATHVLDLALLDKSPVNPHRERYEVQSSMSSEEVASIIVLGIL